VWKMHVGRWQSVVWQFVALKAVHATNIQVGVCSEGWYPSSAQHLFRPVPNTSGPR